MSSSAANDLSTDARRLGDQASASAGRVADTAQDELARLRVQVERLMDERVTPALAGAADNQLMSTTLSFSDPILRANGITPGVTTVGQWRSGVISKIGASTATQPVLLQGPNA